MVDHRKRSSAPKSPRREARADDRHGGRDIEKARPRSAAAGPQERGKGRFDKPWVDKAPHGATPSERATAGSGAGAARRTATSVDGAASPPPHLERIYGRHSVRAVFLRRPGDVRRLLLSGSEAAHGEFVAAAAAAGIRPDVLEPQAFLRAGAFTRDEKHQGVLVLAAPRRIFCERDFGRLAQARAVLALDQISNPQNLATMVRSAAFFGVAAIVLLRDRSADVSAEVVRHAVGGAEFVDIFRVTNLSQSLEALKDHGFFVVGLDERGETTLAQTIFPDRLVLVVGAEDPGLRPKTKKYCDALVRIPGGRRGVESLNAGVATAIAMAEVFRNGSVPNGAGEPQSAALAGD